MGGRKAGAQKISYPWDCYYDHRDYTSNYILQRSSHDSGTDRLRHRKWYQLFTVPVWQSETAPARMKGKLVILQNALLLVGFSMSNWINYGLAFANGPVSWRFPLAFQLVFIIMIYLVIPWLPESPRYKPRTLPSSVCRLFDADLVV